MKLLKLSAAILAATHATASSANSDTTILEDIYVSESPVLSETLQTPYSVENYTSEDIEQSGTNTLSDFLNQKTTISVQPNYGNPLAPKLDMNGFGTNGSENIQIIVDGVSLNNIDLVPQQLSSISLNNIKAIKILQGSGSVLYGNGSAAGAIVIETKSPLEVGNSANVALTYGSHDSITKSLNATGSKKVGEFELFGGLNVETLQTDGSKNIDTSGTRNSIDNDNYSANFGVQKGVTKLTIKLSKNNSEVNYAGSMSVDDFNKDPGADITSGSTHQTYEVVNKGITLSTELTHNTVLSYTLNRQNKNSAYITYSSETDYEITDHKLDLKSYFDSEVLLYGFNKTISDVKGTYGDKSREELAGYLSGNFKLNDKTLVNTGFRKQFFEYADKSEGNDDLNAYDLGINYTLNNQSAIFANFNHAFLVPNFDRLFEGGNFNTNVSPQESNSFTTGYKLQKQNLQASAELFYINLTNEIYYDPTQPYGSRNTNIDKSHKKGVNLALNGQKDGWSYSFGYNFVDAIIDKESGQNYSGNSLPAAPQHTIKLGGGYQFVSNFIPGIPNHKINITHKQTSESYMIDDFDNVSDKAPGYQSTNLSYSVSNKNLNLLLGINNLFDEANGLYLYRSSGNRVYATDYERYYYVKANYQF
ncbi:MAG: TonB-dependent receptor [Pseudomonadota bacterium]|nr:TonB-dependent receptor [Pseudomonadota bacterium]